MSSTTIQAQLFALRDPAYGDFTRKRIPTIDPTSVIGVRTPALRSLAKHYDHPLPYLLDHQLDPRVHNKTIQKAVESYRITPKQKTFLKTLKIKS